jgi:hypothetical protein
MAAKKPTALEVRIDGHEKQIDKIGESMDKMVEAMEGLRTDMAERGADYFKAMNDHAIEDSNRFGKLESKVALYVGMGMCFAAFAPDIIKGFAGGHL